MKALFYAAVGAAVLIGGAAEAHQAGARFNAAAGHRGPVMVQSRAQTWYSDTGWQGGYGPVEAYGYDYGYGGAGMRPPVVVARQETIRHGGYSGATRSMPFGYPVDGYGRYPWTRGGYGGQYQGHYQGGYYQQGHYQGGHDCGRCGPPQPAYYRPEPIYVSPPPIYVSQPPIYVQSPPIYVQPAPVYVAPAQVEVAPPEVHVAPPMVNFDQGYYAVPDAPPPPPPPHHRSPTERPYLQEPGERG